MQTFSLGLGSSSSQKADLTPSVLKFMGVGMMGVGHVSVG